MSEDPDREIARALRLRAEPPQVVRLSRRAVAVSVTIAALSIAAVTGWALVEPKPRTDAHRPEPDSEAKPPEQLAALPNDYAALPPHVPRLGPPLPGDLGRPILASERVSAGQADRAGLTTAQEEVRRERRQALASQLTPSLGRASHGTLDGPTVVSAGEPAALQPSLGAVNAAGSLAFAGSSGAHRLPAGRIIRAALITGLRSDLPGQVLAQVTEDVLDSVSGAVVLIPRGSRLLGAYDNRVAYGQSRILLTWSALVLPNGQTIALDKQPAIDPQGAAGLSGQVDRHWRQLLASTAVTLGLGIGGELIVGDEENALLRALRRAASNTSNEVGARVVDRSLAVQPTIKVEAGAPVRVLLTRDLVLGPWSEAWAES